MSDPKRREARRMLPTILTAGLVVAGVGLAQNSAAFWNAGEPISGVTVQAGTAALAVVAPAPASGATVHPGGAPVPYGGGSITNTGDVAQMITLTRAAAPDAFGRALTVSVGTGDADGCSADGPAVVPGTPVELRSLAPGEAVELCLAVSLPAASTTGRAASTTVTLEIKGEQP